MSGELTLCYSIAAIISLFFLIWGFWDIFRGPSDAESSAHMGEGSAVISRQLRGFAFLIVAQILLVGIGGLCTMM